MKTQKEHLIAYHIWQNSQKEKKAAMIVINRNKDALIKGERKISRAGLLLLP